MSPRQRWQGQERGAGCEHLARPLNKEGHVQPLGSEACAGVRAQAVAPSFHYDTGGTTSECWVRTHRVMKAGCSWSQKEVSACPVLVQTAAPHLPCSL